VCVCIDKFSYCIVVSARSISFSLPAQTPDTTTTHSLAQSVGCSPGRKYAPVAALNETDLPYSSLPFRFTNLLGRLGVSIKSSKTRVCTGDREEFETMVW